MPLRVIELDPSDNYYSMRDRLLRAGRSRTVLVVPDRGVRLNGIDLVLLRRLVDRERLDVGLVTADRSLARQARATGLPAFSNLTLAEHYRPGWWRAGRRTEWVGFAPGDDRRPADLAPAKDGFPSSQGRHRLWFLTGLVTGFFLLSLIALSLIYFIPRANVSLKTAAIPAQVILDLSADAGLDSPNGDAVPAHVIRHSMDWEAFGPVTMDAAADEQRIRAQALQGLSAGAPGLLLARLNPGDMLVPGSIQLEVMDETFLQSEESKLTLRATVSGTAITAADVNRVAYRALADVLPKGFEPDPGSLRLQIEQTTGASPGRFQVTAQATGRPTVDRAALAANLRGRRTADGAHFLASTIPLAEPPAFDVEPGWWWSWFGQFPFRPGHIQVEILP